MRLLRALLPANRLLILLFVLLSGLVLAHELSYARWSRRYFRTSFCDSYLFPVYCTQARFMVDGSEFQATYEPDSTAESGRMNATSNRRDEEPGTWSSGNAGIEGVFNPVPTHVWVDYTSLTERRSYRGIFQLPRRTIDSVYAYLDAHPALYDSLYAYPHDQPGVEFRVGLAPGGVVVVWMSTQELTVDIARFQAQPYPTTWPKHPRPDPDARPEPPRIARTFAALDSLVEPDERARMDSLRLAVPLGHWDSLRTRYAYRLSVTAPLSPATASVDYVSAENQTLPLPATSRRTVPTHLQYTVAGAEFPHKQHSTIFEEREIRRAFAQLHRSSAPGETLELQVVPTPSEVRAFLRNRHQTIELSRTKTYVGPD